MSNIIGFNGGLFTTSYISAENSFQVANNMVLNATTLGDSVVDSNLSSLGTIINLHANNSTVGTLTVGVLNSITSNISSINSINNINGGYVTFRAGTIGSFVTTASTSGSLYSTNIKAINATMSSLYANGCVMSSIQSTSIESDTIDVTEAIFNTVEFTSGTISEMIIGSCTASSMYIDNIETNNGTADEFNINTSTIGALTSNTIDVDTLDVSDGTFDTIDITSGTIGTMIVNSCTTGSLIVGSINILNGGLNLSTNTTTNLITTNATITSGTTTNFHITSSTIGSLITDNIDVDTLSATDITVDTLDITSGTANSMIIASCTTGPLTISRLTSTGSINISNNPMTAGALTISSLTSTGLINMANNPMTSGALSISSLTCSGIINNANNSMTTGTITSTNLIATNSMTAGALTISKLTSFGTINCGTNSMTSGALTISNLTSLGTINSGTNSMTTGALTVSSLISSGSMTAGALSVSNLTSSGFLNSGTNSMTSGALSVSSLTSFGSINCGTNSMTSGSLIISNLTSLGSINCGTNSMTSGSLTMGGLLAYGDINNGTNSMTSGAVNITNLTTTGTITSGSGLNSGISVSRRYPPNVTFTSAYLSSSQYNFRVSATTLSTCYGVGLYSIQTYNTYNNLTTLPQLIDGNTSTYWQPVGLTATSTTDYNTNGTFSISSGTNSAYYVLTTNGTACYGLWLRFFLPVPINLTGIQYQPGSLTNIPTKFFICGSNDNTTFDLLYTTPTNYSVTGVSATGLNTLSITTTGYYSCFMIIFNKLNGPTQTLNFAEYYLLGTEANFLSTTNATYSKYFTVNCPPCDNIDAGASNDNNGPTWYGLGRSIDSGVENYVQLAGYGGLAFKTANPSNQPGFILHSNGCVGIGTTNPSYPLDVNGNARIGLFNSVGTLIINNQSSFTTFNNYTFGSTSGYMPSPGIVIQTQNQFSNDGGPGRLYLGVYNTNGIANLGVIQATVTANSTNGLGGNDTTAMNLALNPKGGNVGIGTTNLVTPFQVWSGTNKLLDISHNSSTYITNPTSPIYIQAPASTISLNSWGITAIANNTGGPGVFLGFNSWGVNSDIRIKTDIMPYTSSVLDKLNNIVVNQFKYINHPQLTVTGFIAQNIQLHFPDIVSVSGAVPSLYNLTEDDMEPGPLLGISSTDGMTPYLVKGIQELTNKVSTMHETIITLQTTINELTSTVTSQQQQMAIVLAQLTLNQSSS